MMKTLKIVKNNARNSLKRLNIVSQLEVDIKAKVNETRVSEMIKEANIEHKSYKVINEVMEVVKDQTMETKEREKRLNNVIIFNLSLITQDRESVLELCTEVNKDFVDTDITELRRLGEAKDDKTRPVLITLSENQKKRGLLRKFFHLKESQKFKNKDRSR